MKGINLNITADQNNNFQAELYMDGDRGQLVRMLAAVFNYDPEVKDVFAEAIYKSSKAVNLPTAIPEKQLTLIEN